MRTTMIGSVEVCTDGQKVWVNTPHFCLARFCKASMEVFPAKVFHDGPPLVLEYTGPGTWERFREAVLLHHKVEVPLDFIPEWASPVVAG